MDHKNRVIVVDHKDHLKQAAGFCRTPNKVLPVILGQGKRGFHSEDDLFCFVGFYVVRSDVLFVPTIPSKVHAEAEFII